VNTQKTLLRAHFDSYASTWHDRLSNHVYAMRYRAVQRMLANQTIGSALDVGCGTGDFAQLFDPARTRYLGIDISENMIAECRRLFPSHEFQVSDGDLIAAQEPVDVVLSIGVLEYLPDPVSHLQALVKVTKPGGSILVTVPNGSNRSRPLDRPIRALIDSAPGKWIRRVVGRPSQTGAKPVRTVAKDPSIRHRHMTIDELKSIARETGLTVVDHSHVSLYLASELIPGAAAFNDIVSRALSDRPYARWLQRLTALVLVAKLEKPSSSL